MHRAGEHPNHFLKENYYRPDGFVLMDLLKGKNTDLYPGRGFLPIHLPWCMQPSCILPYWNTDTISLHFDFSNRKKNGLITKGMPTNSLLNFPLAREKTPIQYSFTFLSNRRTEQKRKKQICRKIKFLPGVTAGNTSHSYAEPMPFAALNTGTPNAVHVRS